MKNLFKNNLFVIGMIWMTFPLTFGFYVQEWYGLCVSSAVVTIALVV